MERMSELFLLHVAKTNGLSTPQAAKLIDKCLSRISAEVNIGYNKLHQMLYTFEGMTLCLRGSCDKATLDECGKMCHCVIYKERCVPRYISDAPEINEDPDKWIKGVKTDELEKFLEYVSYLYYNYDGGGLTDNAFDAIEYTLNKRLKLQGRRYEKIGAEPVEKIRVKLPYPMASLDKVKPDQNAFLKFIKKAKEYGMVWSDKLDGVSGMIFFKDGKVDKMYTRGDGEIGGDVTYLKDYITLPKPSDYKFLAVRGEFIVPKKVWHEKFEGSYANARSFVSAKINTGHISAGIESIQFVAYQVVDWDKKGYPHPSQAFKILDSQGFTTPDHGTFPKGNDLLAFDVITLYKQQREASQYYIDGLVLQMDIPQPASQLSNPEFSKAFKMLLEEQIRSTKVTNIDWNITRHGRYFPVAIYESVYVDGVRLHRASAHNAQHVSDWSMGKGTKIKVARSGDVIPMIKDVTVDRDIRPIFPDNTYKWFWQNKDIVLEDIEGNPDVQIKRITHFFTTIQAPQIGEGRVRKLYESGFKSIKSIVGASQKDLQKIKGFGPKIVEKIYSGIHETMQKTRLDRFFEAITTFKSSIGRKTLKTVIRYYPGILTASGKEIDAHLKKNKIPGIGPAKAKGLVESIPKFREILMDLDAKDAEKALKYQEKRLAELAKKGYNLKIKGKTFVMTGFLMHPDYELEDYIWDHWGDLSSTVTSTTTAVVSANLANVTGKMLKANELHVPVYSIEEFVDAFNIPIRPAKQLDTIIVE